MKLSKNGTMSFKYEDEEVVIFYRKPSMTALGELVEVYQNADSEETAGLAVLEHVCSRFLTNWNLEDDAGNPMPLNFNNIMAQPSDFVFQIMEKWAEVAGGMSAPLDMSSIDLSRLNLAFKSSHQSSEPGSSQEP